MEENYLQYQKMAFRAYQKKEYDIALYFFKKSLSLNEFDIRSIVGILNVLDKDSKSNEIVGSFLKTLLSSRAKKNDCFNLLPLVSIVNSKIIKKSLERKENPLINSTSPRDFLLVKKKPKIIILTCLWKRHELTRIFLRHYAILREELKDYMEIDLIAVGSEGDVTKNMCENNGFSYFEYPNQPLSDKWEFGLNQCKDYDFDAISIIGSDDFFSKDVFMFYLQALEAGNFFTGFIDLYLLDVKHDSMIYWQGYGAINKHKGQALRLGESIGMGRLLSKPLLEKINYSIWKYANINKGLDGHMRKKLMGDLKLLPIRYEDKVDFYCNGSMSSYGQISASLKKLDLFAVDIKLTDNVTQFDNYRQGNASWSSIENYMDFFRRNLPKDTVSSLYDLFLNYRK